MENDLFVIAAGGSGAKAVEALIHLAAAGLCPEHVHVLLVDGDAANGNRKRTIETWNAYKKVQPWPWRTQPKVGPERPNEAGADLFRTKLELYPLAEQFSAAEQGSLRPLVEEDPELLEALGVLLDDQELDMNMRVGFTGRPNLGCLVMNQYLRRHLRNHERARAFIQELEDSARKSDRMGPNVVVIGSVFGGTGASLLPVARPCVRSVFQEPDANRQPRKELYERMHWGKVMFLPYFRPQGGVNLGMVNPARHYVDTSGALWYYGLGRIEAEPIYLIGSDSPQKRKILAVAGEMGQNNPPFYHELLAALAILDFHAAPEVQGNHPIRHFSEVAQAGAATEVNTLVSLPAPTGMRQDSVRAQLAFLLHLAAFSVDWRESVGFEFFKGLFQYAKESELTGWDGCVHQTLVGDREHLEAEGRPCRHVLGYFARLLLWSRTVLSHIEYGASGLDFNPQPGQYASLHNTLCSVGQSEIEVPLNGKFPRESDNLAAQICRLALAGLAREEASRVTEDDGDGPGQARDYRGHRLGLGRNVLLQGNHTVRIGMAANSLASSLVSHGFDKADVEKWFSEFQALAPQL